MNDIEINFFEEYKKLDKFLCDLFNSEKGVGTYIELLNKKNNECYDLKMLKRCRWLRNCIAHGDSTSECNEDDLEFIEYFRERVNEGSDPLKITQPIIDDKDIKEAIAKQEESQESLASILIKYALLFLGILVVSLFIILSSLR